MRSSHLIKAVVISLVTVSICSLASAQTKRLDNNIQLGIGVSGSNSGDAGLATKLSYGLDIAITPSWSIMPSIGHQILNEYIFYFGMVGGDYDIFEMATFSVAPRFHKNGVNIGVGPYFSWILGDETYYIDADPNDPLNNKSEIGSFDYGIQPSISFDVRKHWRFGVEAEIGLPNVMIQYPEYQMTGTRRLKAIMATACFHF
ncbi:MAG: PorT family protein [Bacteroidales bacterium]|nr:PorT family protein [Bacteroidales bacterium]